MTEKFLPKRASVYESRDTLEKSERRFRNLKEVKLDTADRATSIRFARRLGELARMRDKGGEVSDKTLHLHAIHQAQNSEIHLVRTAENFHVAVEVAGPEGGYPLVAFHGMPGSRLAKLGADDWLEEVGARSYRYDRPGFGLSPPLPGRLPVHSIKDVESIARHFGLKEYGLISDSGGGPHALACAAMLPSVRKVAVLGSQAPPEALGESWYAGMHESNEYIFRLAFSKDPYERELAEYKLEEMWRQGKNNPHAHFYRELKGAPEYNAKNAFSDRNAVVLQEALHLYGQGWEDEVLSAEWGFDPRSIEKDVMVVYGGKDVFSPPHHSEWLIENIPHAQGYFMPEATHQDVMQYGRKVAMEWLVAA